MAKTIILKSSYELNKYIYEFFDIWKKDINSRFRSYDHCNRIFRDARKNTILKDEEIDCLALNLFAFLGSWGMFRGSGFLLYKDYKFLKPICKILLNKEYDELYLDVLDNDFKKENFLAKINKIKKEIIKTLNGIYYKDFNLDTIRISNTFISKILLVVFGCVPAFDEYGKAGMRKTIDGVRFAKEFNDNCLTNLVQLAKNYKVQLEGIKQKFNLEYSTMKILDMYFWSVGAKLEYEKKKRNKNKKEQQNKKQ